jgi:xylan 1,4-beta-xylosidase
MIADCGLGARVTARVSYRAYAAAGLDGRRAARYHGRMGRVSFPVRIEVDCASPLGKLEPLWRFFGADEPNYAATPEGRGLLADLGGLAPGRVYFRAHNLLTSGDGEPALKWGSTGVYGEDAQGRPVYTWRILDGIFDTYVEAGIRPFVEIGFMPESLSTAPRPYRHTWQPADAYGTIFTGWAHPPKDYGRWSDLVFRWVEHCVERYGRTEVLQWYWEVWNEPNTGYWQGSQAEFFALHDHAVASVRRALPGARVGGPHTAGSGGAWMREFLDHCLRGTNHATGERGTPLDFVAFHAKGSPEYVDGHVRMGMAPHLRTIDEGLAIVASYPELTGRPVVIGESDPEGCAACQGKELGYRNGTLYSSYTAASFPRKLELANRHGVGLEGALTWAFTFVDQPLFAGFRQLATGGIDLPVLNVFRMLSRMAGRRLRCTSDAEVGLDTLMRQGVREKPDVSAMAGLDGDALTVLLWHYHDDDLPGPDAQIEIRMEGLPAPYARSTLRHYRIDADHSNAYTAWQHLGSPPRPAPAVLDRLRAAGKLAECEPPAHARVAGSALAVSVLLPRQGVSLLVLRPE